MSRVWPPAALMLAILLGLLSGCGDDDTGVGPVGPQGDVGPGEIEVGEESGIPGSGTIVMDARDVDDFDSITFGTEGAVVITRGDVASLIIEVDDNLAGYLESTVVDATLRLSTADGIDIAPSKPPVYRIAVSQLVEIELLGVGEIRTAGWAADEFTIVMRGVGDIFVDDLSAGSLAVDIAGVGSVSVTGKADAQQVTMAGVTTYLGADLETGTAVIVCGDAANAELWATDTLNIRITGFGSVSYYGNPTVTQDADNGTVTPLGDK